MVITLSQTRKSKDTTNAGKMYVKCIAFSLNLEVDARAGELDVVYCLVIFCQNAQHHHNTS